MYGWNPMADSNTRCIGLTEFTRVPSLHGDEWFGETNLENRCVSFRKGESFWANTVKRGDDLSVTVVWGEAREGNSVRVVWSDGTVNAVKLVEGTFLTMRKSKANARHLIADRVELLDLLEDVVQTKTLNRE